MIRLQGVLNHSKKWIIFCLLLCNGIINSQGKLQDIPFIHHNCKLFIKHFEWEKNSLRLILDFFPYFFESTSYSFFYDSIYGLN